MKITVIVTWHSPCIATYREEPHYIYSYHATLKENERKITSNTPSYLSIFSSSPFFIFSSSSSWSSSPFFTSCISIITEEGLTETRYWWRLTEEYFALSVLSFFPPSCKLSYCSQNKYCFNGCYLLIIGYVCCISYGIIIIIIIIIIRFFSFFLWLLVVLTYRIYVLDIGVLKQSSRIDSFSVYLKKNYCHRERESMCACMCVCVMRQAAVLRNVAGWK